MSPWIKGMIYTLPVVLCYVEKWKKKNGESSSKIHKQKLHTLKMKYLSFCNYTQDTILIFVSWYFICLTCSIFSYLPMTKYCYYWRIQRQTGQPFQNWKFPNNLRTGYNSEDTFAMFMENGTEKVLNKYCTMSQWVIKGEHEWINDKTLHFVHLENLKEKRGERERQT